MLGIPTDVVDASEHLLALADRFQPRPIDLGRVNGRYFVASAGVGLDADTTRWVDERSHLKQRAGPLFFSYAALMSFYGKYLGRPPRIEVETNGDRVQGVTAVVQNSDPFTYFNNRPVRVCTPTALDDGCLSMTVLERASQRDVPVLAWKLLTNRGSVSDHSQVRASRTSTPRPSEHSHTTASPARSPSRSTATTSPSTPRRSSRSARRPSRRRLKALLGGWRGNGPPTPTVRECVGRNPFP